MRLNQRNWTNNSWANKKSLLSYSLPPSFSLSLSFALSSVKLVYFQYVCVWGKSGEVDTTTENLRLSETNKVCGAEGKKPTEEEIMRKGEKYGEKRETANREWTREKKSLEGGSKTVTSFVLMRKILSLQEREKWKRERGERERKKVRGWISKKKREGGY